MAFVILLLYGLGILAGIGILIYVISKRLKDKDKEDFEKRRN